MYIVNYFEDFVWGNIKMKTKSAAHNMPVVLYQSGTTDFVNISTANMAAPKAKYLHRSFQVLRANNLDELQHKPANLT